MSNQMTIEVQAGRARTVAPSTLHLVYTLEQEITTQGGQCVSDVTPVSGQHIDAKRPVPTLIAELNGLTVAVQRPTFREAVAAVRDLLNLPEGVR